MKKWIQKLTQKNKEAKTPKKIVPLQFDWESYFDGRELI